MTLSDKTIEYFQSLNQYDLGKQMERTEKEIKRVKELRDILFQDINKLNEEMTQMGWLLLDYVNKSEINRRK